MKYWQPHVMRHHKATGEVEYAVHGPLIEVLVRDKIPEIRILAADVPGKVGNERAFPALHWIQAHDREAAFDGLYVGDAAAHAIAAIRARSERQE